MLRIGTILGNRYEILEKIGAGGMSVVYRARDTKLERSVTVKVLRDEFAADDDFISRFKIEAQAAASLSHPNIVNVYDVGTEFDTYYIVMEYINGCTLKEIITKEAPFDNKKALNYALKIAYALQHAHKNHIVHRDIKPQNILVTQDEELKVTDFGIAHAATSSTVIMTTSAIGSVHYFSPEQARGGYVDEKSDLYSLGIVMYEMVTRKLPFEGDSSVSIALKHINDDLPAISQFNVNISKSLERIIEKATEKRVDQRYADTDSMILDMKKALNDPSGEFIEKNDLILSTTQKLTESDLIAIRKETRREEIELESIKETKEKNSTEIETIEEPKEKTEDIKDIKEKKEKDFEEDKLDKSEEIKLIISAVVAAFAIIAIIFTITYVNLGKKSLIKNPNGSEITIVEVPDLGNITLSEASDLLVKSQLRVKIGESVESNIEAGRIVSQTPAAGSKVPKDTEITISISLGIQTYEVPSLVNISKTEAEEIVYNQKKFTIRIQYEYNNTVKLGDVISQQPKAGEKAKLGDEILIIVSRGIPAKVVKVPNIVGLSEQNAINKLEQSELTAGNITYSPSDDFEKGLVIKQLISAGTEVGINSSVGFVISTGKIETTTTPTTTETTTEATTTIEATTETTTEEATTAVSATISTTTPTTIATTPTTSQTVKSKIISIKTPAVDDGVEMVTVKILDLNNLSKPLYLEEKDISQFPLNVTIQGTGETLLQVYISYNGKNNLQSELRINFDE